MKRPTVITYGELLLNPHNTACGRSFSRLRLNQLSVPLASTFAIATILYAEELSSEAVVLVAFALGLASTCLVFVVFIVTLGSAWRGTLFGIDPVVSVKLQEAL